VEARRLLACFGLVLAPLSADGGNPPIPVVDLHVDLSYEHNYRGKPFDEGTGQYRAGDLLAAGVSGAVLPLFVPHRVSPQGPRPSDLEESYQRVFAALARTPPYRLPSCGGGAGHVQTWLAFEGAAPLVGDADAVSRWVMRGVRLFGLVHTHSNELASSSSDPKPAYGLTAAGKKLVEEVHAAGVYVDISHASDRAAREVLALGREHRQPVIATHSNARRLADHPRNLNDELLKQIADTGGVAGVNFHSPFVVRGRPASLDDVVAQIKYMVKVMGIDHVALGSDLEGDIKPPRELADVRGFPRLAAALEQAGFSRSEIEKIFGRNALRLLCRAPKAR
jgi:membrane dipeptidase